MFNYRKPQYMSGPVNPFIYRRLVEYGQDGVPLGDFLTAILCNDWKEALARADESNLAGMHDLMIFLCNEMPYDCFGSPFKVVAWMDSKGQRDLVPRYVWDLIKRRRSEVADLVLTWRDGE